MLIVNFATREQEEKKEKEKQKIDGKRSKSRKRKARSSLRCFQNVLQRLVQKLIFEPITELSQGESKKAPA
uniref:Uncharacterized protein n=1 Tax=Trichogramma kaykai TaxID=54128 RepID=A0ABD2XAK5_9HYME